MQSHLGDYSWDQAQKGDTGASSGVDGLLLFSESQVKRGESQLRSKCADTIQECKIWGYGAVPSSACTNTLCQHETKCRLVTCHHQAAHVLRSRIPLAQGLCYHPQPNLRAFCVHLQQTHVLNWDGCLHCVQSRLFV